VKLRIRLTRLEEQVTATRRQEEQPPEDVFERMERWKTYARGEGPKPAPQPCPPGFDPAEWASRQRIADYLASRNPPPGLTDEEKAYVDDLQRGFDEWERSLQESGRDTTHPLAASGT
jgi:hypothetical protein